MTRQLYIFYAHYGDYPVTIREMTHEKYEGFQGTQPKDPRLHMSIIHTDTTVETEPIVDIVAITEFEKLGRERAEEISRDVITWLSAHGYFE